MEVGVKNFLRREGCDWSEQVVAGLNLHLLESGYFVLHQLGLYGLVCEYNLRIAPIKVSYKKMGRL